MVPLKQKTGSAVAAAFQSIFNGGRTPKKLWVDKGKEFYNKEVKSLLESKSCFCILPKTEEVLRCWEMEQDYERKDV